MTALFERLAARAAAVAPLAVPGLQLVPRGAIALAEHVNRYYRVLHGTDPENVAVRLPTGGGSFEVRHSATNAALLRVTDAGLDFPAGGIGTVELADGSVTSAKILDNEIVNADVNAAAAIAVAKLAHVGANNVLRSNGTANVAGQVQATDIAHVGAGNVLRSNGTVNVGGQVVNADVAAAAAIAYGKLALANSIVNGDVAAAAGIALGKLAPGAAGVLKSNGTAITAGNLITSADILDGEITNLDINAAANINGSKLLDNSVTSAKLAGGIAVGAGTITTTEIADGTILNVDINAAANIAGSKLLDASVTTAKLAAGAATTFPTMVILPGSSTTSTLLNNMTGGSITLTTQGGPVLILLSLLGMFNSALGNSCNVALFEASVQLGSLILGDLLNTSTQHRMGFLVHVPSAGAHIYVVAWSTGSASGAATHGGGYLSAIEFKR